MTPMKSFLDVIQARPPHEVLDACEVLDDIKAFSRVPLVINCLTEGDGEVLAMKVEDGMNERSGIQFQFRAVGGRGILTDADDEDEKKKSKKSKNAEDEDEGEEEDEAGERGRKREGESEATPEEVQVPIIAGPGPCIACGDPLLRKRAWCDACHGQMHTWCRVRCRYLVRCGDVYCPEHAANHPRHDDNTPDPVDGCPCGARATPRPSMRRRATPRRR